MALSDQEILERIREGEKHRFAAIIDRYRDKGMALACRMLKSRDEAEEAVQDAFLRAFRGLDAFRGSSSFGTWFYRILYNVCLTRIERKGGESVVAGYDDEAFADEGGGAVASDFLLEVELRDLVGHVRCAMERLPEKYAAIISLFYLQELTYREICDVTGLPMGTVKVHLNRARNLLQKQLTEILGVHDTVM